MMAQFIQTKQGKPVSVNLNQLLSHHLLITGMTGSGKSSTLLSLAEQLQRENHIGIIFDATGEFNHLHDAIIYKLGVNANLTLSQLSVDNIARILSFDASTMYKKLVAAVQSLKINQNVMRQSGTYIKINQELTTYNKRVQALRYAGSDYDASKLADQITEEFIQPLENSTANFNFLGQQYNHAEIQKYWDDILHAKLLLSNRHTQKVFGLPHSFANSDQDNETQFDLIYVLKLFSGMKSRHRTLIIDISDIQDDTKTSQLVMDILLKQLLFIRAKSNLRLPVTVLLDEYHRYVPKNAEVMDSGVFKLLREGRKYGLYAVLSTQSPLDLPTQIRDQFGSVLAHRLQDSSEIDSILAKQSRKKLPQLANGDGLLKLYESKKPKLVHVVAPETQHDTDSPRF
ncbi:ATP-binding protein [Leuconostoc citreum]|uniref:ATP-binding protein n=1 Tax=Leuconostoc citreum TaxID=33964 RepID=UPI0032DF5761